MRKCISQLNLQISQKKLLWELLIQKRQVLGQPLIRVAGELVPEPQAAHQNHSQLNILLSLKPHPSLENTFFKVDEESSQSYFKKLKNLGIPFSLIAKRESDLPATRLKFFDWEVQEDIARTKKELDNIDEISKNQEPALFVKSILQANWDSSKKQGSFRENLDNPEKNITVKFSEYEVGHIIHAMRTRCTYTTYHSYESDRTNIKFMPWEKKAKKSMKTRRWRMERSLDWGSRL